MTAQARKLALTKLNELREQGHDPAQVIDQSILNGWKGLFPVHDDQNPRTTHRSSIHDQRADTIAELTGRKRAQSGGQIIDITPTDRSG